VGTVLHVYMRFGKWDEILAYPAPTDAALYSTTVRARPGR
jgi:hypothetical protein